MCTYIYIYRERGIHVSSHPSIDPHTYIYTCIYTCIAMCVYINLSLYLDLHIYDICTHICTHASIHRSFHMYVCVGIVVYVLYGLPPLPPTSQVWRSLLVFCRLSLLLRRSPFGARRCCCCRCCGRSLG